MSDNSQNPKKPQPKKPQPKKPQPKKVIPVDSNDVTDKTVVYQQPPTQPSDETVVYEMNQREVNSDTNIMVNTEHLSRSFDASTNQLFGHYRIIEKLGQGGMGVVYKVEDTRLKRIVALKLISKGILEEKEVQRFITEAQANAQLQHPGIVRLLDVGQNPQNYLTMEYVPGYTLKQIIHYRKINLSQSIQVLISCAEALQYAHDMGIIHRDIKPENIMVTGQAQPKIMDFGLAKIVDGNAQLSQTGDIMGTPAYMSPEQVNGNNVTEKTDIYSLGATLYEILTSRPPFEGKNRVNLWYNILKEDPIWPRQLNPDIPSDIEAICIKCLQKSPEKRYKSMSEFANDLRNFQENKPILAKPPSVLTYAHKFIVRHLAASLAVIIILLSIVVGGVFSYYQWQVAKEQREIAEQGKKQNAKEVRKSKTRLAKIALTKCVEAYKNGEWAQSGAFAGASLDFIKNFTGKDVDLIREQARAWLKQSIEKNSVLWMNFKNAKSILSCRYSGDGRYIITCSADHYVRIWNSYSGAMVSEHNTETQVFSACFNSNYKKIAWCSKNKVVVMDFKLKVKLYERKQKNLKFLHFHPTSNKIIVATNRRVILVTLNNKKNTVIAEGYEWVNAVEFSRSGKLLAIASNQGIFVFGLMEGIQQKFSLLRNNITNFSFSHDEKSVFVIYNQNLVKRWDMKNDLHQKLFSIEEAAKVIARQNNTSIIVAYQNKLAVWSDITKTFIRTLASHTDNINDFAMHPQGHSIVSVGQDGFICNWQLSREKYMHQASHIAFAYLKFNSVGDKMAAHIPENGVISVWNVRNRKLLHSWKTKDVKAMWEFISPLKIAIVYGQKIHIYNIKNGKKIREGFSNKLGHAIQHMLFHRKKQQLMTVTQQRYVHVWDFKTGAKLNEYKLKNSMISCSLSDDGNLLAYSLVEDVEILNLHTREKKVFRGHKSWAQAIAISEDNKLLASGSIDKTVKIWSIENQKCIATIPQEVFSYQLRFLERNRLLSTGIKGKLTIWNLKFMTPILLIPAASSCLSLDERRVALIQNNNLLVVDLKSNQKTHGRHFPKWSKAFAKKNNYVVKEKKSFFDFRRDLPGSIVEQGLANQPLVICKFLFRQQVTEELSTAFWNKNYE
ncbi:protein kinase [Candidatus Uabimicrobium sp. HlEnr_7]|uniref:protein kinase domain-containing protein n=1 Tax=Candidatus Uabimicrobium helgolandensis TaxID=3095367 RepID=UPI003555FDD2